MTNRKEVELSESHWYELLAYVQSAPPLPNPYWTDNDDSTLYINLPNKTVRIVASYANDVCYINPVDMDYILDCIGQVEDNGLDEE